MSRRDDLVQAFDALALAGKHDPNRDRPALPANFVGGFNPGYTPPVNSYQYDHTPTISMPNPHDTRPQYRPPPGLPPGLLPRPPAMPVPQRRQSNTMAHALRLVAQASLDVPVGNTPSRPQSESAVPTQPHSSPSSISQGPPQASSSRRPRASSVPPSPTSGKPSSRDKDTQQCEGVTRAGVRCTRQVKAAPPLTTIHPDASVERFCFQHSKDMLTPSGFYSRKNKNFWIAFDEWIPDYLQDDTKVALRVEMEKPISPKDVAGYIYTYEIRDPKTPNKVHLKVGRAVNLVKRIDQWDKQCGSKEPVLRGWWPGTVEADDNYKGDPSLMKGRVKAGEKGMWCHRLERLVHLELADLVVSGAYLESEFRVKKGGGGKGAPAGSLSVGGTPKKVSVGSPGKKKAGTACVDCGTVHKEIFTFTRIERGRYKGKEWEAIVKPMIEKWGEFVNKHV